MATPNVSSDMAQFFDFGEAAMPDSTQETAQTTATASETTKQCCPSHGNGCLCHGFHDIAMPEGLHTNVTDQPEWNSDFSSWLPRYSKPAQPCDYCRSRSLECFIYNTGGDKSSGCSPCNALFRPCSFSDPEKMPMQKSRTALDTLDVVAEDSERHFGGFTGKKPMRCLGHVGPIEDEPDSEKPKKGASAARFPRAAVKTLKDWMIQHIDHPYPTEDEKEALMLQTGLTMSQISNWMANTRRRQKSRPKRSASPSIRPNTRPMNIPAGRTWDDLNPFERWKHSPPENEPAPLTAIAKAVESFDLPESDTLSSSYNGRSRKDNSNGSTGSFSNFRAPSTTSLETGFTNMSSGSLQSFQTTWSHGSKTSFNSLNSLNSKKERRRRRRMPTRTPKIDASATPRLFQCTFCTDRFKSKYDWSRHEKSLHLSLEKWICAPLGEVVVCTTSGRSKCVYCDALDPDKEHLEAHNHRGCEEKGLEARTFYRKDHLRQHLRLMHGCKMNSSMETWKSEAQYIKSRCGFCAMSFNKWQDRVDHLAKEFRNGADMKDWKGCRGLDPYVATQVTNAMPPYLIADESKSPFPFSATNSASMKQHNLHLQQDDYDFLNPVESVSPFAPFVSNTEGASGDCSSSLSPNTVPNNTPQYQTSASTSPNPNPNATCWEILTLRLGRFARQHIETHGPDTITDELLQNQARYILYDSDDPWNQTAADNPEWLNLFKKSHGIATPMSFNENLTQHEVYEDLGLRPGAKLDSSFDLEAFTDLAPCDPRSNDPLVYECLLAGTLNNSKSANQMFRTATPRTLPELASSTTSGASNFAAMSSFDLPSLDAPISELACTVPGGVCIGENGEIGYAARDVQPQGMQDFFSTDVTGQCSLLDDSSFMPTLQEQQCTEAGDPIFPAVQELECTKAGDPIFPNTTSGSMQGSFSFSGWNQQSAGLMPSTFASSPMGKSAAHDPNVIQGSIGQPQIMRWNDNELETGLMDMDLDLNVDLTANAGSSRQHY